MSDPRSTPDPARVTRHEAAQVAVALTDLCRTPGGARDRQLIYGDRVRILSEDGAWAYVQASKDGYCGHVPKADLGTQQAATHRVSAPATHAYRDANFKSPDRLSLSFGSLVAVTDETAGFAHTPLGFVPLQHLRALTDLDSDPATIAALFLGTPYLWGGNSRWGIDCSGLVQAALLSCGIPCPGDSDQQQSLGSAATLPYRRNDLLFWKGHVALVTDTETLIHANAGSMSTRYEPIASALRRIEASNGGPLTAHRRL